MIGSGVKKQTEIVYISLREREREREREAGTSCMESIKNVGEKRSLSKQCLHLSSQDFLMNTSKLAHSLEGILTK